MTEALSQGGARRAQRGSMIVQFVRGRHLYQIARLREGDEALLGLCDGRIVVRGSDKGAVMRVLVEHWPPK